MHAHTEAGEECGNDAHEEVEAHSERLPVERDRAAAFASAGGQLERGFQTLVQQKGEETLVQAHAEGGECRACVSARDTAATVGAHRVKCALLRTKKLALLIKFIHLFSLI